VPSIYKFRIANKYAFSVMHQNGLVFVDGNENNVDVLNAKDLTSVQQISTDKKASFSFIMIDNMLFCGLAGKKLNVF
jgi:hypothetical protein